MRLAGNQLFEQRRAVGGVESYLSETVNGAGRGGNDDA